MFLVFQFEIFILDSSFIIPINVEIIPKFWILQHTEIKFARLSRLYMYENQCVQNEGFPLAKFNQKQTIKGGHCKSRSASINKETLKVNIVSNILNYLINELINTFFVATTTPIYTHDGSTFSYKSVNDLPLNPDFLGNDFLSKLHNGQSNKYIVHCEPRIFMTLILLK